MISNVRTNAESYLRRNANDLIFNTVKILGIGLIIGLAYLVYRIFCIVFPSIISLTVNPPLKKNIQLFRLWVT